MKIEKTTQDITQNGRIRTFQHISNGQIIECEKTKNGIRYTDLNTGEHITTTKHIEVLFTKLEA